MTKATTKQAMQKVHDWTNARFARKKALLDGDLVPAMAETLASWADQKAIATPDTYTDTVRTTGGDIPIETSAGSKLESIRPVAGSKWTAKMLFNGSYNMLNAAKWGAANSQPYVGDVGGDFVYFLVPELTLGTFGTADENNGLLFTDSDGENVQPTSVYFKSLGATVPSSLTDGTSITPTSVSYDGKTYKDYATSGAGWLIIPKSYYDNDVCAHIAWEDWYDKYVSLDEPITNPEAVVGVLILEGLLALAHSDKYLRGVNDVVCDNVVFSDTSATISHMVDEVSVAAASWTNAATGESDSQGNALYRHSATVSGIKNGGAACVEGEDGGIPLTVNGTTVSYIDTNATAPASVVFYEVIATSTTKAYTDSVFNGSNIDVETGVLPINDCSIEAQVAMDGEANITVKYAKNIVDQVAINATVDVPQIKKQVEEHEERITELEDTAVRTGSYDASVAVGLADNFKGDTIVDAEFYKRKTGGTQSVGSGIAAIKEMRGKSIVWNQLIQNGDFSNGITMWSADEQTYSIENGVVTIQQGVAYGGITQRGVPLVDGHKILLRASLKANYAPIACGTRKANGGGGNINISLSSFVADTWLNGAKIGIVNGDVAFCVYFGAFHDDGYISLKNVSIIDLTLMFGAGNEPATVEEFEKMFPLDYYDYNAGTIIPFAGQNLTTIGFNMLKVKGRVEHVGSNSTPTSKKNFSEGEYWNGFAYNGYFQTGRRQTKVTLDEGQVSATSKDADYGIGFPVKCEPNTQYYCNTTYGAIGFFDKEGVNVGSFNSRSGVFTTPANAAWMVIVVGRTTGDYTESNLVVNVSDTDMNGTYEPYEKHTLPLDPSQWRDKQGNLVFPYGGMHGVGTAYDYAKVDADGYIRKAVRCFEQVDLGDYTYGSYYSPNSTYPYGFVPAINIVGKKGGYMAISNVYRITDSYFRSNKCISCHVLNNSIYVIDDSFDGYTGTQIKNALAGVKLIYELAEPVEVELATPVYAKYLVDKDGTEEITPANGATPYTTMANLSILYAMDARGEIKNLPKNYLSKESAENMLNAMVTAGVIASYTMTWDAANSRYVFVIQKNSEQ